MQAPEPSRMHLIGCQAVIEHIESIIPEAITVSVLDFGLHMRPGGLKEYLADEIARHTDRDHLLLGYGMCSMAVVGLVSERSTLVIPRVDDCVAASLGGQAAYKQAHRDHPTTYYLDKGFVEAGDTILDEFRAAQQRLGTERARRAYARMLKHYTRLAYIDTVGDESEHHDYARQVADEFGLEFVIEQGTMSVWQRLVLGPWDQDFVVAPPGRALTLADFQGATASAFALSRMGNDA